ncbi:MAG: DUF3080 family protein [Saccharospirillum sp.]
MLQRPFQFATVFFAVFLLAGCGQSAEALLENYRQRVENVLLGEVPERGEFELPSYPRARDVHIEVEDIRLDVLDAWAVRSCELFALISERNSILGRVAQPDVRLDYEQRLLRAIPECLADEAGLPDDLVAELSRVLALKQRQLPQRIWNATLAHSDLQGYWNGGSGPFQQEDDVDYEGYRDAQQRLAGLAEQPEQATPGDWVSALEPVAQYPMGGHSLYSMRAAILSLEQTEALLREATESGRLCPLGNPRRELTFARNVMVQTFVGAVQPWLVRVDQRFLAGYEPLRRIHSTLNIDNASMVAYLNELEALHQRFRGQIRAQVDAWQALFEGCGRSAVEP